mgnify:CR=1 FL=1
MAVISIIGHKGGVGKTTLSINIAAAITKALPSTRTEKPVCLFDLDLKLPTITGILNSHPQKTFFNLFEVLANRTYQVDFLQELYQILVPFQEYKARRIPGDNPRLLKSIAKYKNLNEELFNHSEFEFGDQIHELFLMRGDIERPSDLKKRVVTQLFKRIDINKVKNILREYEGSARPDIGEYISYIEEYGFSIIGGEVPILGKRNHRRRINEPIFLMLFLDFLEEVFKRFNYVVLDTPAGGVNHLSSLMNSLNYILFVFFNFMAQPTSVAMISDYAAERLQGRVYGLTSLSGFGVGSLAGVAGGFISDGVGVEWVFAMLAGVASITVISGMVINAYLFFGRGHATITERD